MYGIPVENLDIQQKLILARDLKYIWITGHQSTNPKYLKNAKSGHLIG